MKLRKVCLEDMLFIWQVRNEETSRKCAFNTEPIPYENHKTWFRKSLEDKNRFIFMFENERRIGYVRFDRLEGESKSAEIDIGVAKEMRGHGYGSLILKKGMEETKDLFDKYIAKVKRENIASLKLFQKIGFKLVDDTNYYTLIYERK